MGHAPEATGVKRWLLSFLRPPGGASEWRQAPRSGRARSSPLRALARRLCAVGAARPRQGNGRGRAYPRLCAAAGAAGGAGRSGRAHGGRTAQRGGPCCCGARPRYVGA